MPYHCEPALGQILLTFARSVCCKCRGHVTEGGRAGRLRRAAAAKTAREEEERIMEARRSELLRDEGGYWSKRMASEAEAAAQLAAARAALSQVPADDVAVCPSAAPSPPSRIKLLESDVLRVHLVADAVFLQESHGQARQWHPHDPASIFVSVCIWICAQNVCVSGSLCKISVHLYLCAKSVCIRICVHIRHCGTRP